MPWPSGAGRRSQTSITSRSPRSRSQRLEEILLAALEQRVDAELALGRHRELVGELDELAAQHPLHEPFALRLMLALYRSGRQADALDVYRRTRERLVDGFGIEPGRELQELERAILNQDPSLDVGSGDRATRRLISSCSSFLRATSGSTHSSRSPSRWRRLPGRALLIARLLAGRGRARLDARPRSAFGAPHSTSKREPRRSPRSIQSTMLCAWRRRTTSSSSYWTRRISTRTRSRTIVTAILERSPADVGLLTGSADGSRRRHLRPVRRQRARLGSARAGGLARVEPRDPAPPCRNEGGRPIRSTGREPPAGRRGDLGAACFGIDAAACSSTPIRPRSSGGRARDDRGHRASRGWRRDGLGEARRALVRGAGRRCSSTRPAAERARARGQPHPLHLDDRSAPG